MGKRGPGVAGTFQEIEGRGENGQNNYWSFRINRACCISGLFRFDLSFSDNVVLELYHAGNFSSSGDYMGSGILFKFLGWLSDQVDSDE